MSVERLQKVLAHAGVASRRACEELIQSGRVTVDGEVVRTLGTRVSPQADIRVDGRPVQAAPRLRYLVLHKPSGYVTTARDPQGRPTVLDLVASVPDRIYPVGRLDMATEGLLLLTNDGELAQALMHPRHGVGKRYRVEVSGVVSDEALRRLATGVELEDGPTLPARLRLLERNARRTVFDLTIFEGRKRQIRRMCTSVGHPVRRLVRLAVGPVELGDLAPGAVRALSEREVSLLRQAAGLSPLAGADQETRPR